MLYSEYTELADGAGLPLTCLAHEVAEAIYGAMPKGGHDGHVQAVAWAKKNRAEFEAMVALLEAKTSEWRATVATQGEAIRKRQRWIEHLEGEREPLARQHAEAAAEWDRERQRLSDNLEAANQRDLRSRQELAETREYAHKAANDLATVKLAFRILSQDGPA